jgi:hypothetical protein
MAGEVKKEIQLEIAHVVFADIVGYSKLPITRQRESSAGLCFSAEFNKSNIRYEFVTKNV